jgi:hypothetical protein
LPELTELQKRQCDKSQWDFSDLRALYVNCTLKRSRTEWDAGCRFDFPNPDYR